ncbi:hypothetical protein [Nocardioides sp. InS609-2]|uniref:hypothetical protein n=1 Tax=Nocardioides sp. InS609-2 TaxID=2760705 RepID=UPI0020BE9E3F|nr:hypothetical protein [Nocardioides sp. InS609-2]
MRPALVSLLLACGLALAGCGDDAAPTMAPSLEGADPLIASYDAARDVAPGRAALSLIPAIATTITITDFDRARAELGLPDLTSDDPMTDRNDFWERAPQETVLLTEGLLREQNSRFMLDHGFTQDDVDWEAHWVTPEGPGWVLAFRSDLPFGRVAGAVAEGVGPLKGATADAERHLLSVGLAGEDDEVWGDRADARDLTTAVPAESTYLRVGCVPPATALATHDVTAFDDLEAFSVSYGDGLGTARLGPDRADLFERSALATDAPTSGPIGFGDAFENAVADPSTGRIGWDVRNPRVAAALTLTDGLPWAVCNEAEPD